MGGVEGGNSVPEQTSQQVDLTTCPEYNDACEELCCSTKEALVDLKAHIEQETNLGAKAQILGNNFNNFMSPEQRQGINDRYPHIQTTDCMTEELALAILSDPEIGILEAYSFSGDVLQQKTGESYSDYIWRIDSYRDSGIQLVGKNLKGPRGIAIMPGENYIYNGDMILPIKDITNIQNSSDLRNPTVNNEGELWSQVGGDYLVVKGNRVEAIDPSSFDSKAVQMFSNAVEMLGKAAISNIQPTSPVLDAINEIFDTGILGDDIPKPELVAILEYFQAKADREAKTLANILSASVPSHAGV